MPEKLITKLGKGRFRLITPNVPNGQLILDFNPVIKKFALTGNFQLIHWQARPKNYREWGIYHSKDDRYETLPGFQITGNFKSLQIPDKEAASIPSAVILLQLND